MSVKIERVLVQGTVTFTVDFTDLAGMVTSEQAADKVFMDKWLTKKALELIDYAADTEVEHVNETTVQISEVTANKFTGNIISDSDWHNIMAEHKNG